MTTNNKPGKKPEARKPAIPDHLRMPRFRVHISVNRDEVIEALTFEHATNQLWEDIMNGGYTLDGEELELEEQQDGATGVHAPDVLDYLSAIREGDPGTSE